MANSKSWQVFSAKIRSLKQILQLTDLSLTLAQKHCMSNKGNGLTIAETLQGGLIHHRQLNTPNNVNDIKRTFVTNRNSINQQAIVDLYRAFSFYIKSVISELAKQDPMGLQKLLSDKSDRQISYPEIIKLGSYESVIDEMANKIFRSLERLRSTTDMLDKLITITHISIEEESKEDALLYLELRHLIIHNYGKVDEKFLEKNNKGLVKVSGKKIIFNYALSNKALNIVYALCKQIDDELIRLNLIIL